MFSLPKSKSVTLFGLLEPKKPGILYHHSGNPKIVTDKQQGTIMQVLCPPGQDKFQTWLAQSPELLRWWSQNFRALCLILQHFLTSFPFSPTSSLSLLILGVNITYITFTGTISSGAASGETKLKKKKKNMWNRRVILSLKEPCVWLAAYFFSLPWQLAVFQIVTALLAWGLERGKCGAEPTVNSWWTHSMRKKWNFTV